MSEGSAGRFVTFNRPIFVNGGIREKVQTLTGASTATTITNQGITTIVVTTGEGTAANLIYNLAAPAFAGQLKTIFTDLNSTKEITVRTASSAQPFFGSTKNGLTFSTGSDPGAFATFKAISTSQWALLSYGKPGATSTATNAWKVTLAGATA